MFNLHVNKRLISDTFDQSTRDKKHCTEAAVSDLKKELPGSNQVRGYAVDYDLYSQLTQPDDPNGRSPYGSAQRYDYVSRNYLGLEDGITPCDDLFTPSADELFVGHVCYGVVSPSNPHTRTRAEELQLVVDMSLVPGVNHTAQFLPLELEGFGEMAKATYQDSGKFAGFINIPVICQLLDDIAVQLTTTLTVSSLSLAISAKPSRKQTTEISEDSKVRIVISGAREDRSRVGKLCSDSQLFLQHPFIEECGEIEYSNPHYLLRPGAAMPKLESSLSFGLSGVCVPNSLNEVNKSRIMRIFDSACADSSPCFHQGDLLSGRLKSVLKR
jgi:hypothetical protein